MRGKRRTFSPVTRNGRPKLVNVRQHLSDCCPLFLTSSPFPPFVKIISSIPRRKGGKVTVLGDREVYIKYRRKLIATKCSTFEMIFLTQRHRSRAISEKCNKIRLHKIILSFSLSLSAPLTHLLSASGNYRNGDNHTSETLRHNSRGQEGKERGWMEKRLYTSSYTRLPIGRIVPCPGYSRWWWVEVPIAVELLAND